MHNHPACVDVTASADVTSSRWNELTRCVMTAQRVTFLNNNETHKGLLNATHRRHTINKMMSIANIPQHMHCTAYRGNCLYRVVHWLRSLSLKQCQSYRVRSPGQASSTHASNWSENEHRLANLGLKNWPQIHVDSSRSEDRGDGATIMESQKMRVILTFTANERETTESQLSCSVCLTVRRVS